MTRRKTNKFSPEVRDRTVRTVLDHAGERLSRLAAVTSIAAKIGCTPQTAGKLKALVRETASCSRPMRSRARQAPILRWRSSTAGPSQDRLHRRSSWGAWGRADSQSLADRPLDLPCPCGQAARSRQAVGTRQAGRLAEDRGPACVCGELLRLWRAQGLAPAQARRLRCCPLYGLATDAEMGSQGVIRGKSLRTRSATRPRHARWQPSPNPRRGR